MKSAPQIISYAALALLAALIIIVIYLARGAPCGDCDWHPAPEVGHAHQ